jgi:hypothetical protein
MRRALTAFAVAALALPALAQDALTPAQRDAVDQRIRDYLVENPEVIVEALEALDARRREAQRPATPTSWPGTPRRCSRTATAMSSATRTAT